MNGSARRPLRYRGVNLGRDMRRLRRTRGPWVSLVVALVLSGVAFLTLMAVAGFAGEFAAGHRADRMFLPAAVFTWLFALWVVPRTIRAWRTLAKARASRPS